MAGAGKSSGPQGPPVPEDHLKDGLRKEAEAKHENDQSDQVLAAEHESKKRIPRPVKILLLGQAESGKSTTLKNFRLNFAPKASEVEVPEGEPAETLAGGGTSMGSLKKRKRKKKKKKVLPS